MTYQAIRANVIRKKASRIASRLGVYLGLMPVLYHAGRPVSTGQRQC